MRRLAKRMVGLAFGLLILAVPSPDNVTYAGTFPDAHEKPTPGWTGPVFTLSQDYPMTLPPPETYPWKSIDFTAQPEAYIKAVLSYALEGNVAADWIVQNNTTRKWYHAPWLHSGNNGREFVHGLTHERSSRPKELGPKQTTTAQNFAVGMYNPPGGYVIGQVWKDPTAPDPTKASFPDGTVSVKLLFTQASLTQVPYLKNSYTWQGYTSAASTGPRSIHTVRLLQVDLAVRDSRNDARTGWIFGTFVYDGDATGSTPWDRLEPVGVMWGDDPGVTPTMVTSGHALAETWINPSVGPPQHLGWAGRLNGPVDNKASSCLSCHGTSEFKQASALVPSASGSDTAKLRWFDNIKSGQAFDAGQQSLDYSLQLGVGLQNFTPPAPHAIAPHAAIPHATPVTVYRVSREGTAEVLRAPTRAAAKKPAHRGRGSQTAPIPPR